ncbi:MAG: hypothetical protein V1847_01745 [Candidatus Diapherotrites archaeon]
MTEEILNFQQVYYRGTGLFSSMSKTMIAAMGKHKNANEFVQKFLLPSMRRNRVPSLGVEKIRQRMPFTGTERSILFEDSARPGRVCFLQVQATWVRYPLEKVKQPKVRVFSKLGIPVAWGDFGQAVKEFGGIQRVHPGFGSPNAGGSYTLLLPTEAIAHWPKKEILFKGRKRVVYSVDHPTFMELKNYGQAAWILGKFVEAVMVESGRRPPSSFIRGFNLEKVNPASISKEEAIKAFVQTTRRYQNFFQKLVQGKTEKEVTELISERFDVSEKFAEQYAKNLSDIASTHDEREAVLRVMKMFPNEKTEK